MTSPPHRVSQRLRTGLRRRAGGGITVAASEIRAGKDSIPTTPRRQRPAGHFAFLNTNSSVTPAGARGFVSFISSSVMDVTIRR